MNGPRFLYRYPWMFVSNGHPHQIVVCQKLIQGEDVWDNWLITHVSTN